MAVLKETRREVRELHRLLCTPHVSSSNVWQMEQNGRVAISDKIFFSGKKECNRNISIFENENKMFRFIF